MSPVATAVMAGWLSAVPSIDAVSRPAAATGIQEDERAPGPTSAVRGVVKTVSARQLVITRTTTRHPSDLILVMDRSTLRAGTIDVGDQVSVRYRTDGKLLIATAVTVTAHRHPD